MNKNIYRIVGILSILAAVFLSAADFLLEYHPSIVNIEPAIIDEFWVDISEWRLFVSTWLAAFWLPFYVGGYWLIYRGIKASFPLLSKIFLLSGVYGVIMGSPITHTVLTLNPIVYKFGVAHGARDLFEKLITDKMVPLIMPMFVSHYVFAFIIPPLIFFFTVLSGRTMFKKWMAFLNPLFLALFFFFGIYVLPGIFQYLLPGSINKGMTILFLLGTIVFWDKEYDSRNVL